MEDKVWLFTKEEFLLLAAAAGIRRMYGFPVDVQAMERKDAIYMLQKLSERGCLSAVNEKLELSGPIKNAFSVIRDASAAMEIHKNSGKSCILYVGSAAVKVSPSMRRREWLEVQEIPLADLWKFLKEEGWIPETGPEDPGRSI